MRGLLFTIRAKAQIQWAVVISVPPAQSRAGCSKTQRYGHNKRPSGYFTKKAPLHIIFSRTLAALLWQLPRVRRARGGWLVATMGVGPRALTEVGELHSLTDWQVSEASEDAELEDFCHAEASGWSQTVARGQTGQGGREEKRVLVTAVACGERFDKARHPVLPSWYDSRQDHHSRQRPREHPAGANLPTTQPIFLSLQLRIHY